MKITRLWIAALPLFFLANSIQASVLLSENFDELNQALGVTSAGAFSTINGTNVDIVGTAFALCAAPESGQCVDLDGSGGLSQGQLQSNMVFSSGSYLLSFDLIGSGRGGTASATVTFGSYSQTFNLASSDVTSGIVVNAPVTLSSASSLLFTSNTPGSVGLVLDDIAVSTAATPGTPEPASFFLLGMAMIPGAIAVGRRLYAKS